MLSNDSIKNIPRKPGVYLFKDRSEKILYIGKAKDLSKRLSSYFSNGKNKSYKTSLMLKHASKLEHIITSTEKEALILEGNLIKIHRPRYNVDWKDDAHYPFLKLDINNRYPRLSIVRRMKNDGALYFGPFPSVSEVRSTLRLIAPVFLLRKCTTKEIPKRSRPCLNYQLGRCLGPCCLEVSREDYQEIVDQVKLFLEGRNRELISQLKKRMHKTAGALDFEGAAGVRDQISAVEKTVEQQTVVSSKMKDQDIIGLYRHDRQAEVVVLLVRSGYMVGSRSYSIQGEWESACEILEGFLKQYFRDKHFVPPEILLSDGIDDGDLISEWLTGIAGKKVSISVPVRGDKKKLVTMAVANAENMMSKRQKRNQARILEEAKSLLHLKKRPVRMEAIDVSNLKGDLAVAAIACFVDGVPERSGYRNYRIKEVKGIDDYAMIAEGIKRRLQESKPPDLLVVDGGKGHLAVASKTLDALHLEEPPAVISIAKADRGVSGATDKIFLPHRKNPLILARGHPVLSLLMRIRDETHRRAVSYYRKRKKEQFKRSELDLIPGIGPKRKKALLNYFGNIRALEEATFTELKEVPGISRSLAENVFAYFHKASRRKTIPD